MTYNLRDLLNDAKHKTYNFLAGNKRLYDVSITERRAVPVYGDVVSGLYVRYFTCRSNLVKFGPVYEIDANQYAGIITNPNFTTITLPWRIRGKLDDDTIMISNTEVINSGILTENQVLLNTAAKQIPAILYYIKEMDEYYQGEWPDPTG